MREVDRIEMVVRQGEERTGIDRRTAAMVYESARRLDLLRARFQSDPYDEGSSLHEVARTMQLRHPRSRGPASQHLLRFNRPRCSLCEPYSGVTHAEP